MFKQPSPNGGFGGNGVGKGGNLVSARRIIVRRFAAIGDSLAATVVADKLLNQGFEVAWQCVPSIHCVIRRHPRIQHILDIGQGNPDCNLDNSYEKHPLRRKLSFSQIFMDAANDQLARLGINLGPALNCRPTLRLSVAEKAAAQVKFSQWPKPWVFVCPRSDTYACRQVPDGIWSEAAAGIHGTKFWLGRHPAPPHFVDLKCQHLDNVIVWLSAADLLVTVDTGPMHLAAAMGIPILAINQSSSPELHLSDQVDFLTIEPKGLDCLNCQHNQCPINPTIPPCQKIDPAFIAAWANAKLGAKYGERVSAIIPIYRPDVQTLNKCLECILPQVDEVIVCHEGGNSLVPSGMLQHPKIQIVVKGQKGIGYGRNVNRGVRASTGKYLVLMNDDVFLQPDAVAKMMEVMKPGVGMVANRLMYPDGTVYHAGKIRAPGVRGWGHCEHKQKHWRYTEPVEAENVCGACVLVRRETHFAINGFDEDFNLFGEDDDYALRVRRAGYSIWFTPHSWGTHLEHQSVNKIGDVMTLVNAANSTFHRKWGRYLDHNLNRIPGTFDYV
jgi:GT2 family glycosyltransferase